MVATATAALLVGFTAGLLTFKAKQRWCGRCGVTLSCSVCQEEVVNNGGTA